MKSSKIIYIKLIISMFLFLCVSSSLSHSSLNKTFSPTNINIDQPSIIEDHQSKNDSSSTSSSLKNESIWKRINSWLRQEWKYFVFAGAILLIISCLFYGFSHKRSKHGQMSPTRKVKNDTNEERFEGNLDQVGMNKDTKAHDNQEFQMSDEVSNAERKSIGTMSRSEIKLPTLLLNRNLKGDTDLDTPGVMEAGGSRPFTGLVPFESTKY